MFHHIVRNSLDADIAIVGGGAAGFFAAIHAAQLLPNKRILLLEKNNQFLYYD
jgi:hypothetical protein